MLIKLGLLLSLLFMEINLRNPPLKQKLPPFLEHNESGSNIAASGPETGYANCMLMSILQPNL
jgi:hypothetical protein